MLEYYKNISTLKHINSSTQIPQTNKRLYRYVTLMGIENQSHLDLSVFL